MPSEADTPVQIDRSRTAAAWALRVCTAGMCVGYAYLLFKSPTALAGVMREALQLSERDAWLVEIGAAAGLLAAAALVLVRPIGLELLVIAVIVAWIAGVDAFTRAQPLDAWLTVVERSTRYLGPICLLLIVVAMRRKPAGDGAAVLVLRLAAATAFAAHGFEAVRHKGAFVELIRLTFANLTGVALDEVRAELALTVIGMVDIICAGLVLVAPWRPVVAWMAFWGFATAASRMTAHGMTWWAETAIRLPNGGVPLALLCLWWNRAEEDEGESNDPDAIDIRG